MLGLSNFIVGLLNLVTLVVSLAFLRIGWWFRVDGTAEPLRILQWPFLTFGLLILFLSFLGLFGACCQVPCFLEVYLCLMFIIMLGLFCFMVFAFFVTNKEAADAISGIGYENYKIGDYSHWLQDKVGDHENWDDIVSGLKDAKVCMAFQFDVLNQLYNNSLTPIQFGCCRPPIYCGFTFVNATNWSIPESNLTSTDIDCKTWSNDLDKLCYACNSCKVGVLENIKAVWHKISIYLSILLLFLNIIYSISYCALQNNRIDRYYRFRGGYY